MDICRYEFIGDAKTGKKVIDPTFLACAHHAIMVGIMGHFLNRDKVKSLIVGLGGGALATFLSTQFKMVPKSTQKMELIISRLFLSFRLTSMSLKLIQP